jgi:transcriptional regulator GlxA family with amidase domain
MSRSAFMERFRALVGVPPIRYLTALRLEAARVELRESRRPVAQLTEPVGCEAEEAFSRAFKREDALAPAHWRDRRAA